MNKDCQAGTTTFILPGINGLPICGLLLNTVQLSSAHELLCLGTFTGPCSNPSIVIIHPYVSKLLHVVLSKRRAVSSYNHT